MNKLFKKVYTILTSLVLTIVFIFSSSINSYAYTSDTIKQNINETANLMYKTIPEPTVESIGGEWTILSLARSGVSIPQDYYDAYYKRVEEKLKSCDGKLHSVKYTEYSRVILALTSIGKDVTNVAGYNLLSYLTDFNNVKKQGINGPIFALIAFDTNNYEIPQNPSAKVQNTRQAMIDYILDKEIKKGTDEAGGWALSGTSPDPDITFMAIQALSNYMNQPAVKEAVDRALTAMSEKQLPSGGYASWGSVNSESTAQAVVALTSLGINLDQDSRFIKTDDKGNENTVIDALLYFYCEGGGFAHIKEGYDGGSGSGTGLNAMATDQGMYALVAYNRYLQGQNKLYDMTDVTTVKNSVNITFDCDNGTEAIVKSVEKDKDLDYTPETPTKAGYTFVGWYKDTDNITTAYENNSKYAEDVTYKAKWAHVEMLGAQAKAIVNDKGGIRFGTKLYDDGDEVVEKGTLIIPASFLKEGETLTLDTPKVAKSVANVLYSENKEEKSITYLGTIVNIPKSQFNREMTASSYVKYKDKAGNTYTVYSPYKNTSVTINNLLKTSDNQ